MYLNAFKLSPRNGGVQISSHAVCISIKSRSACQTESYIGKNKLIFSVIIHLLIDCREPHFVCISLVLLQMTVYTCCEAKNTTAQVREIPSSVLPSKFKPAV